MKNDDLEPIIESLRAVIEMYADMGIEAADLDDAWRAALLEVCPDFQRVPDPVAEKFVRGRFSEIFQDIAKHSYGVGVMDGTTDGPVH